MEIRIPSHVVVYALGCLAVIVIVGGLTWVYLAIEQRITRKRERDATKRK